ncbi:MAG: hypothetical protein EB034_24690, partial [Verrucomicrobia bacterium]|nr:hypothetical protein [Verrucomicrobiota bacterium]
MTHTDDWKQVKRDTGGRAGSRAWEQMMESTHASVKRLDTIYGGLLGLANQLKQGGDAIRAIEELLDQARPVAEEDRRLASFMCFMASLKR